MWIDCDAWASVTWHVSEVHLSCGVNYYHFPSLATVSPLCGYTHLSFNGHMGWLGL